jgi:hypothetical protein
MPRYSLNRELGKLATANAERRDKANKAQAKQDVIPRLPDPDRWDDMKSAQPKPPQSPT